MKRKMKSIVFLLLISNILAGCVSQQESFCPPSEGKKHSANTPEPRTSKSWTARHNAINERLKKGKADMLFVGDSITHFWEKEGREIWDSYYAPRKAVNMGISGDRTQHVLWRLDNSNFRKISPKLAVVMIGTNNCRGNDNTAEEIADGIIDICRRLQCRLPKTKILLLAIFPRDAEPSERREKNAKASPLASQIADGEMIHYLDINSSFLTEDGILSRDIMPDYLHPNKAGYKIWAEAMEAKIAELMGEKN